MSICDVHDYVRVLCSALDLDMGFGVPVIRLSFVGSAFYTKTPRVLDICGEDQKTIITV